MCKAVGALSKKRVCPKRTTSAHLRSERLKAIQSKASPSSGEAFSRQSKSTSQYEKRPAFSRPSVHFISSGRQDFPDRSAAERSIASKPQQKRPAFSRPSVHFISSGRQDSNLRSPGPKPGAVTGLGHAPSAVSGGKDSPNYSVCNFT